MAKYTTAPASQAERSESGNPDLMHVLRDGSWYCTADAPEALEIAQGMEFRHKTLGLTPSNPIPVKMSPALRLATELFCKRVDDILERQMWLNHAYTPTRTINCSSI